MLHLIEKVSLNDVDLPSFINFATWAIFLLDGTHLISIHHSYFELYMYFLSRGLHNEFYFFKKDNKISTFIGTKKKNF